jgi:uridine kinase
MVTQNINEVLNLIISSIDEGAKIISVDGETGAGKSSLTRSFKCNSNIEIISFENYYKKHTGHYLDVFYYDELKEKIKEVLSSSKIAILDGICMDQILNNISLIADFKIYIKRLDSFKEWYFEKYLDENKTMYEIILKENEENNGWFYDLVKYHRDYKPQDNSDVIFENIFTNN